MKNAPKIRVPHVEGSNKNTGLVLAKGTYYVWHYEGNKRPRTSTNTGNVLLARLFRKRFYEALVKEDGATAAKPRGGRQVATPEGRKQRVLRDPSGNLYIVRRKPFAVVVAGKVIAECDTSAEARVARNKYFGI